MATLDTHTKVLEVLLHSTDAAKKLVELARQSERAHRALNTFAASPKHGTTPSPPAMPTQPKR